MTFKQKIKIINLITILVTTISLFLPHINDSKSGYNIFNLISKNGIKALVIILLISVIIALISSLACISYDKNKFIPIVTIVFAFLSFLIELFIKKITSPSGFSLWNENSYGIGYYLLFISAIISCILNIFITIRTFVFKKNDDDYSSEIEYEEPNDELVEEIDNEDEIIDEELPDSQIIDEFTKK